MRGASTCGELSSRPQQWLLNDLVELLRQPLKHRRYPNDHVFKYWCLRLVYLMRVVDLSVDHDYDDSLRIVWIWYGAPEIAEGGCTSTSEGQKRGRRFEKATRRYTKV